jgi:hypothetical protein
MQQADSHGSSVFLRIKRINPSVGLRPIMPSNSDALLRSVRRWLLVAVFLLGIGVIGIADIAFSVSDYGNSPIPAAIGVPAGLVALIAGLKTLGTFLAAD